MNGSISVERKLALIQEAIVLEFYVTTPTHKSSIYDSAKSDTRLVLSEY
jgi:hypothetical protein